MLKSARKTSYPIDPLFTDRWSPRSFTDEVISDEVLMQMFEAARWAPSSYNYQPWRFVYAKRGDAHWKTHLELLIDVNQAWAHRASALVYIVSDTLVVRPGQDAPVESYTHILDAGFAFAQLSLQATRLGWFTHGMQGFDKDRAPVALGVPGRFRVNVAVAVGKIGSRSQLSEYNQAREMPSDRVPLAQLVGHGTMPGR